MQLFDRSLHRRRRDKAAAGFAQVDFLVREAAARLADRLLDIDRQFPLAAELGCHGGQLAEAIAGSGKVGTLMQADLSEAMVRQAEGLRLVADEEQLPFAEDSLGAIFSVLSLQWVNDLPGCLIQCRKALKPDGLLLAALPGPRTLQELRESILAVSVDRGLAPRISPFVEVRDAGGLLQRAGFALPVVDNEIVTVNYKDRFKLLHELQKMGEGNALIQRHKGLTGKEFWPQVMEYYQAHYALADGRLPATAELVFLTGWKPYASQQQPARRGSGQVSLGEVFSAT